MRSTTKASILVLSSSCLMTLQSADLKLRKKHTNKELKEQPSEQEDEACGWLGL